MVYGLKSARMETTTPEGLGRWLGIQKNRGSRPDPSEYLFDQDRIGVINEREIKLQFETSDGRIGTYRLIDFNSPFTQLMKLQELPEAIRKEIRAGEADWLVKAAAWDAQQKSGGTPPPPL